VVGSAVAIIAKASLKPDEAELGYAYHDVALALFATALQFTSVGKAVQSGRRRLEFLS
jgi:hypothetical protein